jgi:putative Holliday junction resolvase
LRTTVPSKGAIVIRQSSFAIPYYHSSVRAVAIDFGGRRVGLAVSDASRTLARPLETLTRPHGSGDTQVVAAVLDAVEKLERDADPVDTLVVGVPRRLDGSPNEQTPKAEQFVAALRAATTRTVVAQDERLTSREPTAAGAPQRLEETQGPPHAAAAAVIRRSSSITPGRADAYRPMRRLILVIVLLAAIAAAVAGVYYARVDEKFRAIRASISSSRSRRAQVRDRRALVRPASSA